MLLRPEELPGGNIPTPTTCVAYSLAFRQVGFTAAQLLFRAPALRELFSESILYMLAFPDIGQQPLHFTRRLVSSQKFVRWHIVQISADRAAVNDHGMRADDVENEFRWKKASIVLAKRGTVTFRERVSQSAFVFHPTLKPTAPSQNPFCFAGGAERREPFAHRQLRGVLPEGKHPIGVKRSVLQICLLFGRQNEGFRCGRTIYVNSVGLHGLENVALSAIVGYVNALFATIEPHPYEWNSDRVMLLRALVYRAEMVVGTESFECGDERSRLRWRNHHILAALALPKGHPSCFFNETLLAGIGGSRSWKFRCGKPLQVFT